ncbi:hypothetical protein [Botrimarina mediterranea]|uniref:hypothetical protein n=1 Tax=Botrimarina mediterranea TaxID=2528022 RepID=UPI0011A7CC99|nr:hypothetical protein [Botrimarina mediterranea]
MKPAPSLLQTADTVLRGEAMAPDRGVRLVERLACVVVFGGLYGAAMGLYRASNSLPQWEVQLVFSAIKAPLLILGAFAVSLPTFFVLSTLLGLRRDFSRAAHALVTAQAAVAVTLASLAPLTVLLYVSSQDYRTALLFNGAAFAVASVAGQFVLRRNLRPLIARDRRHRLLMRWWAIAYVFVAVQLAWLLRPFIGSAALEVQFLRPEAWDNAYVVVARLVWKALLGW